MALFGRKKSKTDDKEIKDIINKNIASSLRTQPSFSEILKLNGCPTFKLGSIGSKIRKQLLKEAKNGDLTVETVMPRSYELIGEFLGVADVKTFEDISIENNAHNIGNKPVYCSNCGDLIQEGSKFCPNCGNKLIIGSIECSKCGKINEPESRFCVKCGNNLKAAGEPKNNDLIKKNESLDKKIKQDSNKIKFSEETRQKLLNMNIEEKIEVRVNYLSIIIDNSPMVNDVKDFQEIVRKNEPCDVIEFNNRLEDFKSKLQVHEKLLNDQKNEYQQLFKKIIDNENMASKLKYRSDEEELQAIALYEENISYGICCNSFYDLSSLYNQRKEFDKGIEVAQKGLKLFEESGKPTRQLQQEIKYIKDNKNKNAFTKNHQLAIKYEEEGKIDEAIELHLANTKIDLDYIYPHDFLGRLYHYKKDFEKERDIYKMAIAREEEIEAESEYYNPSKKFRYEKDLENVESYLETGRWKYDCLPADPKPTYYQIKEAKTLLKSEDKEKGIVMLENLMDEGSYNNTVYYSLYQTYKKDKKYDECIRVCDKAIENLGLFSQDRLSKWTEYKDKIVAKRDKELSK